MIAFNPHNVASLLGIGQCTDGGEEIPVASLEPRKVESAEDIAQKDELPEVHLFQHGNSFFRAAHV